MSKWGIRNNLLSATVPVNRIKEMVLELMSEIPYIYLVPCLFKF